MITYKMRKDYVLIKVSIKAKIGALHISETSDAAKEYTIVASSPDNSDLHPGDKVTLFADKDTNFYAVPGTQDMIIIQGKYVSSVIYRPEILPASNDADFHS